MKHGLIVGLIGLAVGCGSDATDETIPNNSFGKSDGAGDNTTLEFRGSMEGHVAIGEVARCELTPSRTIMEWHVPDPDISAKLTISLSHPGGFPESGDVLLATTSQQRIKLEGVYYTSEGADRCDILIDEFVSSGPDAGVAVSLDKCEMVHELFTNMAPTRVSGSLFCQANPGSDNVCEPDTYDAFVDDLATLTQVRRPNHDAIEAHIATLDCDATLPAHYVKYLELFENLMERYGRSIDSTELTTINMVAAIAPKVTDSESYKAWLEAYEAEFKSAVPRRSDSIDPGERAFLDQYHAIVPITTHGAAYVAWSSLFGEIVERAVPRSTSTLDADEEASLDELISVMPITQTPDAYEAWFDVYARFFNVVAVPASTSSIDSDESNTFHILRRAKPNSTFESSYIHWLPLFRHAFELSAPSSSSAIEASEQTILNELVLAKPSADGDAAYIAWLAFYSYLLDRALGGSMILYSRELNQLQVPKMARPSATNGEAYLAWLDVFKSVLERTGSSINRSEEDALKDVLSNQPCGRSDRAAAAFRALVSEYSSAAERFVQEADPSVCEF